MKNGKRLSFKRIVSAFALGASILQMGCPLLTGEVSCRALRDCPEVFHKCDLDGVEDGGIGLCVPGTAPTGIPVPENALIDFDGGLPDGGLSQDGIGGLRPEHEEGSG